MQSIDLFKKDKRHIISTPLKSCHPCYLFLGVGIGVAQCIVSIIVAIYYNVIMAYCLYYIFASFQAGVFTKLYFIKTSLAFLLMEDCVFFQFVLLFI